ncbi:subtilisin-like protease SBT5.4 [Chenopodium quinoa]|uniref:subtilisin-like protease SBT5.4 n=1 Tax=Chenopodium quinoa TaxID=63459 RepID=UPI000B78E62B|nr:subtilisin-like protease SBT5.4 [Chenopodium quinoa]
MQIPMLLQHCLLLSSLLFSLQQLPTYAAPKHYIVYLGSHHAEPRLLASPETITKSHHDLISSVLRSDSESSSERIIYSYNKIYNGFAATLHEEEANELSKHPSVVSIFESRILESTTTRSADFLGLHYPPSNLEDSIWHKANLGDDIILANIDSGVWPEIQSFSDDENYGPIPKKFKGACENKYDPTFKCNRKLIGARYFYKAMEKNSNLQENCTFNQKLSPRDDTDGHGTHTLSTAGGSIVPFASWGGLANGTAIGMAPKARLVAYKTNWNVQCPTFKTIGSNEIDVMAAFEAAIDDGVDVINYSQASNNSAYLDDGTGIATFHAMKNGILTIAGAGNSGPNAGTAANNYPWVLSVGASTIDRVFSAHVLLGNNQKIKGTRFYDFVSKVDVPSELYPLITGADARISGANVSDASLCQGGSIDVTKVTGKILVCRNAGRIVAKDETLASVVARDAGAVGMIFVYEEKIGDGFTLSQFHAVNTIVLSYKDGETLFSYINSTRTPTASISGVTNTLGVKPSPIMGSFSSRGPNQNNPGILKPDVTAPGVDILAACPPEIFQSSYCMKTGTSMATPHVAGIAALIKKVHPDWSTAAIKSAIMTTASPLDNDGMPIRDSNKTSDATPFAYGSGHVKPNMAMDPGLVYDMNQYDYLNFICAYPPESTTLKEFSQQHSYKCPRSFNILDFNYPSISIVNFTGNAIVTRKLKNVGPPGTYVPRIEPPPGVSIMVEPKTLVFSQKDQIIVFKLILTADINHLSTDYIFGSLVWSDAKHVVRSPIIVKAKNK